MTVDRLRLAEESDFADVVQRGRCGLGNVGVRAVRVHVVQEPVDRETVPRCRMMVWAFTGMLFTEVGRACARGQRRMPQLAPALVETATLEWSR